MQWVMQCSPVVCGEGGGGGGGGGLWGNEGVGWYVQRWVVRVQGVGCGVWDKENEGVRCAG